MTVRVRADRRFIRSTHRSDRFVLAEIEAPVAHSNLRRPPVHLAFVLDRSGSMSGAKIRLAKEAVEQAIARLRDDDRFAIVVYDDQIDLVVPSTPATAEARRTALDRLRGIDARGSTNLAEGWLRGCEQVAERLAADGVNRCLLLTDGLANVGIVDVDELRTHAGALRSRGVSTSTFGVGDDFDEVLLQAMADAGGGHFYYIADAASIRDHITSEVGEALEVVARGAALEVIVPEGVRVETLSPYPSEAFGDRSLVSLGDLVSGQVLAVVLRLNFPYGTNGSGTRAMFRLSDRDGVLAGEDRGVAWEYADDRTNDTQERDREVDRAVAGLFASRARQAATGLNRKGDYRGAREELAGTVRRISGYAGRDRELREIVAGLERDMEDMSAPMMEALRKKTFFASSNMARMRSPEGAAMRSDDKRDS